MAINYCINGYKYLQDTSKNKFSTDWGIKIQQFEA